MKHRILILAVFVCLSLPLSNHITASPNETPSSLEGELMEVRQRETADLQALANRVAGSDDRVAILELQREMAGRKFQAQIEMLEIRGRHARDGGRIGQAEEIEKAVVRLRSLRTDSGLGGGDRP